MKKNITRVCCFIAWVIVGFIVSFGFFLWDPPPIEKPFICTFLMSEADAVEFSKSQEGNFNINTWAFLAWFLTLSGFGIFWGFLNWNITTGKSQIDEKHRFRALFPWALIYPTIITGIIVLLIVYY